MAATRRSLRSNGSVHMEKTRDGLSNTPDGIYLVPTIAKRPVYQILQKAPALSSYSSVDTVSTAQQSGCYSAESSHSSSIVESRSTTPPTPAWPLTESANSKEDNGHTGQGEWSDFMDELDILTPTPSELPEPTLPKIDLEVLDAQRQWHGICTAPPQQEDEVDEILNDYGAISAQAAQISQTIDAGNDVPGFLPDTEAGPGKTITAEYPTTLVFPTTQLPAKPPIADEDGKLRKLGRRKILVQKYATQAAQLSINGFCIFASWWWTRYHYVLLPLILMTVALNIVMVFSIIVNRLWRAVIPEKKFMPEKPESLVLLVPCYNETKEELIRSLDSLVIQRNIEQHKQAIMIICDGKVRGPGMEKTTADYLLEDILVQKDSRKYLKSAYTAWDQQPMDVVLQRGTYHGLPYICIIKQQNQGKRDGLIVVRSFLYNFNRRNSYPSTVFAPNFFNEMATFLIEDASMDTVDHLIGMDADTVFDPDCIRILLDESHYPGTVGVCGYVSVDWKDNNWNLWRLYQSAEYTIAQALRRLHQSIVTHKVSCLPGCCQLLKICEETCGDYVLLDLFGYCPGFTDGLLLQIRATASEDRNHVCHMLSARPKSLTRQALHAKAYTDVPGSWAVFLSQRRRWTLGATSNDLLLITAPGVQWFERILAAVNVQTWFFNPFIFASIVSFIFAMTVVPLWILMIFLSIMLIPIVYYLFIPVWLLKRWTEKCQFWAGCLMYVFCGPIINISVLLYALTFMDSFGWGKTRKVIEENSVENGNAMMEKKSSPSEVDSEHEQRSTKGSDAISVASRQRKAVESGLKQRRDLGDEERSIGLART